MQLYIKFYRQAQRTSRSVLIRNNYNDTYTYLRKRRGEKRWGRERKQECGSIRREARKEGARRSAPANEDRRSPSSKTHPVAFQCLRAVLLLLLEAAAALALVEYVRRELPALGAGAADAAATARRATRHIRDDTCELTVIAAEAQHRLRPSFLFNPSIRLDWLPVSPRIRGFQFLPAKRCVRSRERSLLLLPRSIYSHKCAFNHSSPSDANTGRYGTSAISCWYARTFLSLFSLDERSPL